MKLSLRLSHGQTFSVPQFCPYFQYWTKNSAKVQIDLPLRRDIKFWFFELWHYIIRFIIIWTMSQNINTKKGVCKKVVEISLHLRNVLIIKNLIYMWTRITNEKEKKLALVWTGPKIEESIQCFSMLLFQETAWFINRCYFSYCTAHTGRNTIITDLTFLIKNCLK